MKITFPLLLIVLACALPAAARDDDESAKAASGMRFMEIGGKGSAGGSDSAVDASGTGDRSAMDLVNAESGPKGLKTGAPPTPMGEKVEQGISTGKWAMYGTVGGALLGGALGMALSPAGAAVGATKGAELGAVVGAAAGGLYGYYMNKGNENSSSAPETHQTSIDRQLNAALYGTGK